MRSILVYLLVFVLATAGFLFTCLYSSALSEALHIQVNGTAIEDIDTNINAEVNLVDGQTDDELKFNFFKLLEIHHSFTNRYFLIYDSD